MGALTYNSDDDRYTRRELQALKDNLEDTNTQLLALLFRLRADDDLRTYEARAMIHEASGSANASAVYVHLALLRLPEPVTA